MGNRSYLSLGNSKQGITLFEANNSLPFFWILLLDENSIDPKMQIWKRYEDFEESHSEAESEDFLRENPLEFEINYEQFVAKSIEGRKFIHTHFQNALPLYDDFIEFIKNKFERDSSLQINMVQFAEFYESYDDFSNAIKSELNAVKTNNPNEIKFLMSDDLIASGTGFEEWGQSAFAKSQAYQHALNNRAKSIPTKIKQKGKFNKNSLITCLVILAICPLFSVIGYKMIHDQGFNFSNVIIILSNIGFYIFSIWEIVVQIKLKRNSKI